LDQSIYTTEAIPEYFVFEGKIFGLLGSDRLIP
jgi:hypothetical protein